MKKDIRDKKLILDYSHGKHMGFVAEVEFKKIRGFYIRIREKRKVSISVPVRTSETQIRHLIESRIGWIEKKLQGFEVIKYEDYESRKIEGFNDLPKNVILWGEALKIIYLTEEDIKKEDYIGDLDSMIKIQKYAYYGRINDETALVIIIRADLLENMENLAKVVSKSIDELYRFQVSDEISRTKDALEVFVGRKALSWHTRKMRSRWGSCNYIKRKITISTLLARRPKICLRYVMIHELVHLYEPSHGKRFKELMARFFPNSKSVEMLLKER